MWQSKREISRECNDIIGTAKGSQISDKYWGEVGKGKRVEVYLEVRKRRGIYFLNETSACAWAYLFYDITSDFQSGFTWPSKIHWNIGGGTGRPGQKGTITFSNSWGEAKYSNIPAVVGVWCLHSKLIRYARVCVQYSDFLERGQLLSEKLLRD